MLWVKDRIRRYKGDGDRVAVTGDSAGGHLSAMVVNLGDRLSSRPFAGTSLNFQPSYLPAGKTAEQVAQEHGLEVQAAILSYGAFDIFQGATDGFESVLNPFWLASGSLPRGVFGSDRNVTEHPELYRALSPAHNIPPSRERRLPPQLLTIGTDDPVVSPASVNAYLEKLRSAGHPAEYWAYDGRSHAFLDSGSNALLGSSFEADAPPARPDPTGQCPADFFDFPSEKLQVAGGEFGASGHHAVAGTEMAEIPADGIMHVDRVGGGAGSGQVGGKRHHASIDITQPGGCRTAACNARWESSIDLARSGRFGIWSRSAERPRSTRSQ